MNGVAHNSTQLESDGCRKSQEQQERLRYSDEPGDPHAARRDRERRRISEHNNFVREVVAGLEKKRGKDLL